MDLFILRELQADRFVSAESKGLIYTKIVQNLGCSELRILKDLGRAKVALIWGCLELHILKDLLGAADGHRRPVPLAKVEFWGAR